MEYVYRTPTWPNVTLTNHMLRTENPLYTKKSPKHTNLNKIIWAYYMLYVLLQIAS